MNFLYPIFLSVLTFISTSLGGLFALKYKKHLHQIMGFSSGIILGVIAFDLLPEIAHLTRTKNLSFETAMISLVIGFLVFHTLEKLILIHHSHEEEYKDHHHPDVGVFSALALAGHSFLDGVGIGLGFQINMQVGFLVALAVIGHDFADGLNTVTLMLKNKNTDKKAFIFLVIDALAPILGAASTLLFVMPDKYLIIYLGVFAGTLLYIGVSDILPEAHSKGSSVKTIALTILGALLIFLIIHLGH
jgi:ZIP family zinc transporter